MEQHAGVGAHERWTVEKHFSFERAVGAPSSASIADLSSPLAKRGTVLCGLKTLPLNTKLPGPAERTEGDDILDEALAYIRTDTLHRTWAVDEASEKTLIYLTRFCALCLQRLEACATPAEGKLAVQELALAPVTLPSSRGSPLESLFLASETRAEGDALSAWLSQAHSEASVRLLQLFYTPKGLPSALWKAVAHKSHKFMSVYGVQPAPVEEEVAYRRNLTSSRSIEVLPPN